MSHIGCYLNRGNIRTSDALVHPRSGRASPWCALEAGWCRRSEQHGRALRTRRRRIGSRTASSTYLPSGRRFRSDHLDEPYAVTEGVSAPVATFQTGDLAGQHAELDHPKCPDHPFLAVIWNYGPDSRRVSAPAGFRRPTPSPSYRRSLSPAASRPGSRTRRKRIHCGHSR
jgi:hypothetical protein